MEGPICEWMRRQYNISIRLDWTRACIQWLQNEGGMNHHDVTSSRENVYQQWLHSDIRQSCTGCLPSHVTSAPSGTLNGQYILQVDSVVDVGSSAYSQLMKLKGREVDEPSNQSKNVSISCKTICLLTQWQL
jgi:RecQ-mediated genome instability protein 1